MTPLEGPSSYSVPLPPLYPDIKASETSELSGLFRTFHEMKVWDAELETQILGEVREGDLDAAAIGRLRATFHEDHHFPTDSGVHIESLASVLDKIFNKFGFRPTRIEIAGSYVYKILGWDFVLHLFFKGRHKPGRKADTGRARPVPPEF